MITGTVMALLRTRFGAVPALSVDQIQVYTALPMTSADDQDLVLIGHDGDWESDRDVEVTYTPADVGGRSRYELGVIPCALICQTGDEGDTQGRYDRATVLLAAMENALVSDLNSGTSPLANLVMSVLITSGRPRPLQNKAGVSVLIPFDVTYRAQV